MHDLKSNKIAQRRILASFQFITENGIKDLDKQKCEIVRGGVIELKFHSDGLRFFGFWDNTRPNILVLERGWKKGSKKEQDRQIDEVIEFKKEYAKHEWPMEE